MSTCKVCGLGLTEKEASEGVCFGCKEKAVDTARKEKETQEQERYNNIILTTESNPNLNISKRLEIITAECVFGMNIFRDFFTNVRNIFGGRSRASQKVLRDLRKKVLSELRAEAYELGAEAVVAVKLDYSEMSGQGNQLLFVVASGTAVKLDNSRN